LAVYSLRFAIVNRKNGLVLLTARNEICTKTLIRVKGNGGSSRLGEWHVLVTAEYKKAPAFFAEAF
jgi:hypothetical protein